MLIDWFTVAAQVLNFLVLVWLLKHFLYKPVLDAVDARERRIAAELADAAAKKTEAEAERAEFARRNAEFDRQRAELLAQATGEAEAEQRRLAEAARKDADALRIRERDSLDSEIRRLRDETAARAQAEAFAVARKVLADLADESLEARAVERFVRLLRELDDSETAKLAPLRGMPSVPTLVRSAFELPVPQRAWIEASLEEILSIKPSVRYETTPERIGGIELTLPGWTLAWNVADALAALERNADSLADHAQRKQEDGG